MNVAALQKFYDKAFDWVLYFGPKVIIAIIVFFAGEWLIKVLRKKIKAHFRRKKVTASLRPFFQSLIFTALQVLLVLLVMQILGIQLTIFAAVIAAFGAAVGLALSGTLQNFASGILILLLKPFRVGDNIVAQNEEGTVKTIQLFYTILTTFDNRTVILPNSKLSNEVIINITLEGRRRLDITMKFGFNVDIEHVRNVVLKILSSSGDVFKEPMPKVGIESFDTDGYKLLINIWVKAHGFQDMKLTINKMLLEELQSNGIIQTGK
jgi:small conductance mechanosensitive channel